MAKQNPSSPPPMQEWLDGLDDPSLAAELRALLATRDSIKRALCLNYTAIMGVLGLSGVIRQRKSLKLACDYFSTHPDAAPFLLAPSRGNRYAHLQAPDEDLCSDLQTFLSFRDNFSGGVNNLDSEEMLGLTTGGRVSYGLLANVKRYVDSSRLAKFATDLDRALDMMPLNGFFIEGRDMKGQPHSEIPKRQIEGIEKKALLDFVEGRKALAKRLFGKEQKLLAPFGFKGFVQHKELDKMGIGMALDRLGKKPGNKVLCAHPSGKNCYILESVSDETVTGAKIVFASLPYATIRRVIKPIDSQSSNESDCVYIKRGGKIVAFARPALAEEAVAFDFLRTLQGEEGKDPAYLKLSSQTTFTEKKDPLSQLNDPDLIHRLRADPDLEQGLMEALNARAQTQEHIHAIEREIMALFGLSGVAIGAARDFRQAVEHIARHPEANPFLLAFAQGESYAYLRTPDSHQPTMLQALSTLKSSQITSLEQGEVLGLMQGSKNSRRVVGHVTTYSGDRKAAKLATDLHRTFKARPFDSFYSNARGFREEPIIALTGELRSSRRNERMYELAAQRLELIEVLQGQDQDLLMPFGFDGLISRSTTGLRREHFARLAKGKRGKLLVASFQNQTHCVLERSGSRPPADSTVFPANDFHQEIGRSMSSFFEQEDPASRTPIFFTESHEGPGKDKYLGFLRSTSVEESLAFEFCDALRRQPTSSLAYLEE